MRKSRNARRRMVPVLLALLILTSAAFAEETLAPGKVVITQGDKEREAVLRTTTEAITPEMEKAMEVNDEMVAEHGEFYLWPYTLKAEYDDRLEALGVGGARTYGLPGAEHLTVEEAIAAARATVTEKYALADATFDQYDICTAFLVLDPEHPQWHIDFIRSEDSSADLNSYFCFLDAVTGEVDSLQSGLDGVG